MHYSPNPMAGSTSIDLDKQVVVLGGVLYLPPAAIIECSKSAVLVAVVVVVK